MEIREKCLSFISLILIPYYAGFQLRFFHIGYIYATHIAICDCKQ